MAFHCAWVTSYFSISKAFVIRTWCGGFSSFLQLLSSGEHPIMNSPAEIFTNSIPMAFFSAPVWAIEETCAARQVTAIANVPRKTILMNSPPQLCLGACFQIGLCVNGPFPSVFRGCWKTSKSAVGAVYDRAYF